MDWVLVHALLLLSASLRMGSQAWNLDLGITLPQQPEAWHSHIPLDNSLPGTPLVYQTLFHTPKQVKSNSTWSKTESDWRFCIFAILLAVGSLVFLCFRPPIRNRLVSICDRIRRVNRNNLRNFHIRRSRPRNYGTIKDTASQSLDPKDAEGKDSQGECDGDSKTKAEECGDRTGPGAVSEATVEVEDVV